MKEYGSILPDEAALVLGKFDLAGRLFEEMMTSTEFTDFMPLMAYDYLL